MSRAGNIRAGGAFIELGARDRLRGAIRAAQRRLKAFGATVLGISKRIAVGIAAIGVPFAIAVRQFAKAGDALDKMSKRTGFSVEALSELRFAAEQSGSNLETLEKGSATLSRNIFDLARGLTTASDAFGVLGLNLADLEGLSPEQQFLKVANELSKLEDDSLKTALAMQLFGRAGRQLLPMLKEGEGGIEALRDRARELGLTMATEDATAAAQLTDTLNELRRSFGAFMFDIVAGVSGPLLGFLQSLTNIIPAIEDWLTGNSMIGQSIKGIADAIEASRLDLAFELIILRIQKMWFGLIQNILDLWTKVVKAIADVFLKISGIEGEALGNESQLVNKVKALADVEKRIADINTRIGRTEAVAGRAAERKRVERAAKAAGQQAPNLAFDLSQLAKQDRKTRKEEFTQLTAGSVGGFSSGAAGRLGQVLSGSADRQTRTLQSIDTNIKKLVDSAENEGLVFQP